MSTVEEDALLIEPAEEPIIVERRHGPRRDTDRSRALAELSRTLAESIGDASAVLDAVVRLVAGFLGDTAVIRLLSDDGTRLVPAAAYDVDTEVGEMIWSLVRTSTTRLDTLGMYQTAVQDAQPLLVSGDALEASYAGLAADARQRMIDLRPSSTLICPLRVRNSVIGTLGLWRRNGRPSHSERDQSFCQELADRAALAIDNARLVSRLRAELEERTQAEEGLRLTAELLQRADEKRRTLIESLVSAQEEERRRIALDVHDDSIQAMAAVALRLQSLRRRSHDAETMERITAIEDAVTESISRLRGLLFQLDSASLEKIGLARAVTQYMHQIFPDGDPRCRVRSQLDIEPTGHIRVVIYRIAQEALNNVRKHAHAHEVTVVVAEVDDGYLVTIQDDGVGFDPDAAVAKALPGHLGLRSMRERAEIADGWFSTESGPDAGTLVRFWIPSQERAARRPPLGAE